MPSSTPNTSIQTPIVNDCPHRSRLDETVMGSSPMKIAKIEPCTPPSQDQPCQSAPWLSATPPPRTYESLAIPALPPPPPFRIDPFYSCSWSAPAAHGSGADLDTSRRGGVCGGVTDEWTVDLPVGDPAGAWATFDALLPLILRGCA